MTPAPSSTVPDFEVKPPPAGGDVAAEAETDLPLVTAPAMPDRVRFHANRSSVVLIVPAVQGAKDYRAFAVEEGVTIEAKSGGREYVGGATITCAGLRQRNQCDDGVRLPVVYNNPHLDMAECDVENSYDRRPSVPAALMQTIEVNGIGPNTKIVVEAIDRQCPFPGLIGTRHEDVKIAGVDHPGTHVDAVVNGKSYSLQRWQPTFPLRTEAEVRAQYGSLILNGQGPNMPVLDPTDPAFPESPYIRIAQPAPADDPVVLARSVIQVSPTSTAALPIGFSEDDVWEDFDDPADQPRIAREEDYTTKFLWWLPLRLLQTRQWNLYDVGNEFSDMFVDRGQIHMVMGDAGQDVMSTQAMYPKRPFALPTAVDQYLHVTYEVQRNETFRRYENLAICGADQVGQTYEGDALRASPKPNPGFMNEAETARTSPLGWNCLYLVPRGPGYSPLPGAEDSLHSESSLKITVVKSHPAPETPDEYNSRLPDGTATAFGPTQESGANRIWQRQVDARGNISGVWLDDQLNVWQRTKFDVFVRRDRVVIYVNGEQRICQNLAEGSITMAEAAVGFWHILYHTSAEFDEMRNPTPTSNPLTAQYHLFKNTPFADHRSWDNVGIRENVTLPAAFEGARCLD